MVWPAGFINIKVLLTFNKLKKLTTKVEDVSAAFEEDSDVVEVRKSTRTQGSRWPDGPTSRTLGGLNPWSPVPITRYGYRMAADVIIDRLRGFDIENGQLNPEKTMLKRKNPLPEEDTAPKRTLYVSGLTGEATETPYMRIPVTCSSSN